jgi:hypothetical protein
MKRRLTSLLLTAATLLLSACIPITTNRHEIGTRHGFYVANNSSVPVFIRQTDYQTFLFPGEMDHFVWDTRPVHDSVLLVFGDNDTVWHRIDRNTMTLTPAQHNLFDSTAFVILDTIEINEPVSPDERVHGFEVRDLFQLGDDDR